MLQVAGAVRPGAGGGVHDDTPRTALPGSPVLGQLSKPSTYLILFGITAEGEGDTTGLPRFAYRTVTALLVGVDGRGAGPAHRPARLARYCEFPVTIGRRVSGCALARLALRIECLP